MNDDMPRQESLDLMHELERPGTFQRLVDRLPPSPERTLLRLWGALYQVYPLGEETKRKLDQDKEEIYRTNRLPVDNS